MKRFGFKFSLENMFVCIYICFFFMGYNDGVGCSREEMEGSRRSI